MTKILHNSDLTSLFSRPCLEIKCLSSQSKVFGQTLKKYLSLLAYLIYMIYNAAYAELKILRRRCFDALPPHLLAYLHFRRKTAGAEGMRLFPIFVLLKRQERGFFFNFHHWPSLNMPETKSGQVNIIGCALALLQERLNSSSR